MNLSLAISSPNFGVRENKSDAREEETEMRFFFILFFFLSDYVDVYARARACTGKNTSVV